MKYREIKLLGEGSYGKVYLLEDTLGNQVVAKIILKNKYTEQTISSERYIPLVIQEGGCKRNISCVTDFVNKKDFYIIFSEYIEGVDMENWIIPQDKSILINIAYELAEAFEYMHMKKIVHKDIKPKNIIISKDNHPIIIDFGFSCITEELNIDKRIDKALCKNMKIKCGTPLYIAPELLSGYKNIDLYATDIYSLGLVFFYMFNNKKLPVIVRNKNMPYLWLDKVNKPYIKSSSGTEMDCLIDSMVNINTCQRPKISKVVENISSILKMPNRMINTDYKNMRQLLQLMQFGVI